MTYKRDYYSVDLILFNHFTTILSLFNTSSCSHSFTFMSGGQAIETVSSHPVNVTDSQKTLVCLVSELEFLKGKFMDRYTQMSMYLFIKATANTYTHTMTQI